MALQDVFKIKEEYDVFIAEKKSLIDDLTHFISAAKNALPALGVGSFPYHDVKVKIIDSQVRLKTEKRKLESHLWSFNEIFLPEYKKQITDCEKNYDVVFQKAQSIVDRNDMKAKNFELIKKVLDDFNSPENEPNRNEMKFKLLLYKALQSLL